MCVYVCVQTNNKYILNFLVSYFETRFIDKIMSGVEKSKSKKLYTN